MKAQEFGEKILALSESFALSLIKEAITAFTILRHRRMEFGVLSQEKHPFHSHSKSLNYAFFDI